MEHRSFLQTLTREQRISLTQKNNRQALIRLGILLFCFVLTSAAIVLRAPLFPVWLLVQGLLLVSLFHLMHECVHDTVFAQRWPNRALALVCGFILFLPATWFRYFHHAHHRYTQQPGFDPELASTKPATIVEWLVHVSGVTIWRAQLGLLLSAILKPVNESFVRESKERSVRLEMLLMLFLYGVLFLGSILVESTALLYLWIVPLLIGQPFLRLYLLAEHGDCEQDTNMLLNTRTVLTNSVVRWFTWNMPYHTEHHVYPTVPFHQLPQLHALMHSYLAKTDTGYTQFTVRYVRGLAKHP